MRPVGLIEWSEEGVDFTPLEPSNIRKFSFRVYISTETNDVGKEIEVKRFWKIFCFNSPVALTEDGVPIYEEEAEIDELAFEAYCEFFERMGFEDPLEILGQQEEIKDINLYRAA